LESGGTSPLSKSRHCRIFDLRKTRGVSDWSAEHCSACCGKIRCFVPSNARRSDFAEVTIFSPIRLAAIFQEFSPNVFAGELELAYTSFGRIVCIK
jgi:hypothetical protein